MDDFTGDLKYSMVTIDGKTYAVKEQELEPVYTWDAKDLKNTWFQSWGHSTVYPWKSPWIASNVGDCVSHSKEWRPSYLMAALLKPDFSLDDIKQTNLYFKYPNDLIYGILNKITYNIQYTKIYQENRTTFSFAPSSVDDTEMTKDDIAANIRAAHRLVELAQ